MYMHHLADACSMSNERVHETHAPQSVTTACVRARARLQVIVADVYASSAARRRAMLERVAKATGFRPYPLDVPAGRWLGGLQVDRIMHTGSRAVANFNIEEVST